MTYVRRLHWYIYMYIILIFPSPLCMIYFCSLNLCDRVDFESLALRCSTSESERSRATNWFRVLCQDFARARAGLQRYFTFFLFYFIPVYSFRSFSALCRGVASFFVRFPQRTVLLVRALFSLPPARVATAVTSRALFPATFGITWRADFEWTTRLDRVILRLLFSIECDWMFDEMFFGVFHFEIQELLIWLL